MNKFRTLILLLTTLSLTPLSEAQSPPACTITSSQLPDGQLGGETEVTVTVTVKESYTTGTIDLVINDLEPDTVSQRAEPPAGPGVVYEESFSFSAAQDELAGSVPLYVEARFEGPGGRGSCDHKTIVTKQSVTMEGVVQGLSEGVFGEITFTDEQITSGFRELYSGANAIKKVYYCRDNSDEECEESTLFHSPVNIGERVLFTGQTFCPGENAGSCGILVESFEVLSEEQPLDVNGDGAVSPIDALLILNQLNLEGPTEIEGRAELAKLDTNGDGFISPMDALLVINYLNAHSFVGRAEGEEGSASGLTEHLPMLLQSPDVRTTILAEIDMLCGGSSQGLTSDLTGNGQIGLEDVEMYLGYFGIPAGDLNLDGTFDSRDLVLLFSFGRYEKYDARVSAWYEGDFNCDGVVNSSDLAYVMQGGGYGG